ncbi:unnamed protein product [Spodoptera littoralis]|uniref:Uncharacterized protein n=1 Tax=Spodoptera littoralis TaxID=7109 RepID=A0A9P0HY18_SPOLI|nr:unnamed protein product [Spodoptera littoralis]CAH1637552.1 unnamed protein product [Spodoptera littoralis]
MSLLARRFADRSFKASRFSESAAAWLLTNKRRNTVEWWYFGPVILAVVMFLLMGTIFERKIEAIYRRILERRQAQHLAQQTENQEIPLSGDRTTSLHTVKTPSQRTLGSYRAGSTTTEINAQSIELKTQCIP